MFLCPPQRQLLLTLSSPPRRAADRTRDREEQQEHEEQEQQTEHAVRLPKGSACIRKRGRLGVIPTHGRRERWVVPRLAMFLFFSNRLGCLGSLLVSVILTIALLLILDVL
jgi:hypothetical protein